MLIPRAHRVPPEYKEGHSYLPPNRRASKNLLQRAPQRGCEADAEERPAGNQVLEMRRDLRRLVVVIVLGTVLYYACYEWHLPQWFSPQGSSPPAEGAARGEFGALGLTGEQCARRFPGLEAEIERAVAEGPFELTRAPDDVSGSIQGRIKDGKACVAVS